MAASFNSYKDQVDFSPLIGLVEREADIPIFSIICNHNQTYTLTAVGVATVVSLGRSIIKH